MKCGFQYCTLRVGQSLRHFWLGCLGGRVRLWEIRTKPNKLSSHMVEIKSPESESILRRLNQH